jgi:hypothetical protein
VALEREIDVLETQFDWLVAAAAPRTLNLLGVSTQNGGQLLVSAGENIERLHSEAAFAHLCGVSPISASSGRTRRHRLNYGGDRQANRALHLVAVCRLRYCPRTRAYAERRSAEGLSKREILRCLKRSIAREVDRTLRADLAALETAAAATPPKRRSRQAVTISCGAGPIGTSPTRRTRSTPAPTLPASETGPPQSPAQRRQHAEREACNGAVADRCRAQQTEISSRRYPNGTVNATAADLRPAERQPRPNASPKTFPSQPPKDGP